MIYCVTWCGVSCCVGLGCASCNQFVVLHGVVSLVVLGCVVLVVISLLCYMVWCLLLCWAVLC